MDSGSYRSSPLLPVLTVGGGILFLAVLFFLRLQGGTETEGGRPSVNLTSLPKPGLPARPSDVTAGTLTPEWVVRGVDGSLLRMGDLQGKVVVLNLWATWCPPCLEEMPALEALYRRLDTDDVAVVLVSEETDEVVRPFVARMGYDLPIYSDGGVRPRQFLSDMVPATYLVDRKGRVRWQQIGAANWNDDLVVGYIRALAEEPAG